MKTIRVVLVDDHRMLLAGLQMLLQPLGHIEVVGTATSAAEAYTTVAAHLPDVVLLDLNLPDQSGVEVCRQLTAAYPRLRVLVLTTLQERSYVTRLMQEGASGYVLKNASPEELAEAIARVQAGKKYFSEAIQELLLQPEPAAPTRPVLTRREREVLQLLASGLTSQQMADQLFLSTLTIETHRRNLLTKFGAPNTAVLVRLDEDVDVDEITVAYPSIFEVMDDLQSMGESNAAINRRTHLSRDALISAAATYAALHGLEDGSVPATYGLLYMIGWKPSPEQRKPLERGSAGQSLKDVL